MNLRPLPWILGNGGVMAVIIGVGTVVDPEHAAGILGAFFWLLPTTLSAFWVDD